jgi:RNA polymerase sigma-70 factor (ECF subfamily)
MPGNHSPDDLITLMQRWAQGDTTALDELVPLFYSELRSLAMRSLGTEKTPSSLKTLASIDEVYQRVASDTPVYGVSREHLVTLAAQASRRMLVELALRERDRKATRARPRISEPTPAYPSSADVIKLDSALNRLANVSSRQARVVALRYFGGLTVSETASALGIPEEAVVRAWRLAQAWLQREVDKEA